jgi:hypothetical protein
MNEMSERRAKFTQAQRKKKYEEKIIYKKNKIITQAD